MKIIILGTGIIGITSAWFLKRENYDVIAIDRQSGPAQETSFANGCQISVSNAEPLANPNILRKIFQWFGKEDAPILYRFRPEWLQWKWAVNFLRECTSIQTTKNIRQIIALCEYSRQTLQAVRSETNIEYDHLTNGILHFYTEKKEFELSLSITKLMRNFGCQRNTISADEVIKIEPALMGIRHKIVGGNFTPTDESGDAYKLAIKLAQKAKEAGVKFQFNTTITKLITENSTTSTKITGVEIIDCNGHYKILRGDVFVVALGSFSEPLLRSLGINLLIYPGKGYSATYRIINPNSAPIVSLTDDSSKLVISRLNDHLRVAGTYEFNGYTRELNNIRCETITRRIQELFPDSCDYNNPLYWAGLRPLTPSSIPYIGKTKFHNLFINTGHGSLGWTMGCGSGRAIAEIISGRQPEVDFNFTGIPCELSFYLCNKNNMKRRFSFFKKN